MIRAVLFDVDDTLVDTRGAFRHALEDVTREHLPGAASTEDVLAFWRADANGWYRAHTRGEISYREQRMRRANDLHRRFGGVVLDDAAYELWDAQFERHFQEGWTPHADAADCLDALNAAGVPYGGLSNAALKYQELKLSRCGLASVPMLVGVDTLGIGKPDPAVFALACERLGVEPPAVAYVGDEYDTDAIGAADAGLGLAVWLDRPGGTRHDAPTELDPRVVRIESLAEVGQLLQDDSEHEADE